MLFIPGNAGSSRQARSIASSAARQYFADRGGVISEEFSRLHVKPLDVFTADFNEDFSALHEPTLLAQRQYILDAIAYISTLYPSGSRVFLVGHSMGGIVATSVLPHPIVSGVITLSTPHAIPPARYSAGMEQLYRDIYQRLTSGGIATPIISICGGATDLMIPSESCMLPAWPESKNRVSLFSSAMEGCWTGLGHQVSVWCHQIRWRVARAILEAQNRSNGESFKIINHWLNDGVHPVEALTKAGDTTLEWSVYSDNALFVDKLSIGRRGYLFPISSNDSILSLVVSGGKIFNHGATAAPDVNLEVFFCSGSADSPNCDYIKDSNVILLPAVQSGRQFPMPGEGVDEENSLVLLELKELPPTSATYIGLLLTTREVNSRTWIKASTSSAHLLQKSVNLWSSDISRNQLACLTHLSHSS